MSNTKSIAYVVEKGGDGKTTFSLNHALFLEKAHPDKKTVVIDIDPQGNATSSLSEKNALELTAYDLYLRNCPFSKEQVTLEKGINVVASSRKLLNVDTMGSISESDLSIFKNNIKNLLDDADYIIIDCPPSLQFKVLSVLTFTSFVLSPITLSDYSLDGLANLLKTISAVQQRFNPDLKFLGLALNKYDVRSRHDNELKDKIEKAFPAYVIPQVIGVRVSIKEASSLKIPVWEMKNNKGAEKATKEISEVLAYITNKMESA